MTELTSWKNLNFTRLPGCTLPKNWRRWRVAQVAFPERPASDKEKVAALTQVSPGITRS